MFGHWWTPNRNMLSYWWHRSVSYTSFIYDSTSSRYNLSFTMSSDLLMSCLEAVLFLFRMLAANWLTDSQSQSQSHIATDGQSVSQSWYRAPSRARYQIFIIFLQLRFCFLWGALSDKRTGLSFVYASGSCQRSLCRVRVPWYSRPYFTVSELRLRLTDSVLCLNAP
jgi:hypothetical protein